MVLKIKKSVVFVLSLFFILGMFLPSVVLAADAATSGPMQTLCDSIKNKDKGTEELSECASTPADCGNQGTKHYPPPNCLFLEEPIGGEPEYDLYTVEVMPDIEGAVDKSTPKYSKYTLWRGGALKKNERGPVQAVLIYEQGKEYQGPFGLLYNYVQLIYKFMSGVIVGFVVLMVIIGGITMSTAAGDDSQITKGKSMIVKALVGMAMWFLASVILYTINPTFFAF